MTAHVCEPHRNDREGGWTNCHHCFKSIRVDGVEGDQCRMIVPHVGRCDLKHGHVGLHQTNGIRY